MILSCQVGQACTQRCWTRESAAAVCRWFLLPPAPYTWDTSDTTLLPCRWNDVQYPGVVSLCFGAQHSSPCDRNVAVSCLEIQRDHQREHRKEPDRWLHADSLQTDLRQRSFRLWWRLPRLQFKFGILLLINTIEGSSKCCCLTCVVFQQSKQALAELSARHFWRPSKERMVSVWGTKKIPHREI